MKTKRFVVLFSVLLLLAVAPLAPAEGKGKPCEVAVNVNFTNRTGDMVRGDAQGTYFDDATILCDGRLIFLWGSGRTVTFDLSQPADGTSPRLGPFDAAGNLGVEIAETDGLLGMDPNETNNTTKVQFNFVVGNTRYFLQLGSNYEQDVADVTRRSEGSWVIEASSTDKARLVACPARGKCSTPTVVGYYFVPFQMTLVQQ